MVAAGAEAGTAGRIMMNAMAPPTNSPPMSRSAPCACDG